jgi:hypothetical protein
MPKVLRILIPLLLVGAPAAALASSGSSQVWVTNCTHESYKPATLILACGDGNSFLQNLSWSTWSTTHATGKGSFVEDSCTPNCASGKAEKFATTIALSKPKKCAKKPHRVFDDLSLTYTGKRPSHTPKTVNYTLGCPY